MNIITNKWISQSTILFPDVNVPVRSTLFQIICKNCSSLKEKNSATLQLEIQDTEQYEEVGDWTISITCPLCSNKEIIKVCSGDGSY